VEYFSLGPNDISVDEAQLVILRPTKDRQSNVAAFPSPTSRRFNARALSVLGRDRNKQDMERSKVTLQQQLPSTLRNLQPAALKALHHPQTHHDIPTLPSQIGPEIHGFDPADPNALSQHFQPDLGGPSIANNSQLTNAFEHNKHPRHYSAPAHGQPQTPQQRQSHTFQQHHGGQFGVLTPQALLPSQMGPPNSSIGRLQQEQEFFQTPEQGVGKSDGHFHDLKVVPHPPNLEEWREKLFHVNETITLTEEE